MARYAFIQSGKVVQCVESDAPIAGWVLAESANVGDDYVNGSVVPATPPVVVPSSVTMRQARLALLGAGKLAAVQSAIDALSEPTKTAAQIEWEYSNEVQRHNGLVASLGPALNLTSEQIDTLFIEAAKL